MPWLGDGGVSCLGPFMGAIGGAIAGCHSWVPLRGGAIAGCRGGAIRGCHGGMLLLKTLKLVDATWGLCWNNFAYCLLRRQLPMQLDEAVAKGLMLVLGNYWSSCFAWGWALHFAFGGCCWAAGFATAWAKMLSHFEMNQRCWPQMGTGSLTCRQRSEQHAWPWASFCTHLLEQWLRRGSSRKVTNHPLGWQNICCC